MEPEVKGLKNKGISSKVRKTDIISFETEKDGYKYTLQYDEKIGKVMLFIKQLIRI